MTVSHLIISFLVDADSTISPHCVWIEKRHSVEAEPPVLGTMQVRNDVPAHIRTFASAKDKPPLFVCLL
jgi:hypothetical protein